MELWIRFERQGEIGFGRLESGDVVVYEGDMFESARATGERCGKDEVRLLTPVAPGKIVALWNNFHALAAKLGVAEPAEPLYLLKSPGSALASGEPIRRPASYDGKVVFEGELGIVIGKFCRAVSEADAPDHIFGYTCVNDVTAADILNRDPAFPQWARAKSFDTFGAIGPAVGRGIDPMELSVKTYLDGVERQNYPVADMFFPPARLVSLISRDMTLFPGDVIACGTSVGVGSIKSGSRVDVVIDSIGTLSNVFEG